MRMLSRLMIAAGVIGGISLTSLSAAGEPALGSRIGVEGSHLPPVLTLPGESVRLRYAIVCRPRDDGEPCDGSGEVYVRAGQSGSFERLALTRGADSREGRYFVDLPSAIAGSEQAKALLPGCAAERKVRFLGSEQVRRDSRFAGFGAAGDREAEAVQPGDESLMLWPVGPGSVGGAID